MNRLTNEEAQALEDLRILGKKKSMTIPVVELNPHFMRLAHKLARKRFVLISIQNVRVFPSSN
jgi:hypothetical protein